MKQNARLADGYTRPGIASSAVPFTSATGVTLDMMSTVSPRCFICRTHSSCPSEAPVPAAQTPSQPAKLPFRSTPGPLQQGMTPVSAPRWARAIATVSSILLENHRTCGSAAGAVAARDASGRSRRAFIVLRACVRPRAACVASG